MNEQLEQILLDIVKEQIIKKLPAGANGMIILEAFNRAVPAIKLLIDDHIKSLSTVHIEAPVIVIENLTDN